MISEMLLHRIRASRINTSTVVPCSLNTPLYAVVMRRRPSIQRKPVAVSITKISSPAEVGQARKGYVREKNRGAYCPTKWSGPFTTSNMRDSGEHGLAVRD